MQINCFISSSSSSFSFHVCESLFSSSSSSSPLFLLLFNLTQIIIMRFVCNFSSNYWIKHFSIVSHLIIIVEIFIIFFVVWCEKRKRRKKKKRIIFTLLTIRKKVIIALWWWLSWMICEWLKSSMKMWFFSWMMKMDDKKETLK